MPAAMTPGSDTSRMASVAFIRSRRKSATAFARILGCIVAFCAAGADSAAPASTLKLAECRLEGSAASVRCGWMTLPENREAPQGAQVRIHVAVIPSLRATPEPDPLVILTGGPGQAASDFYGTLGGAFGRIRRNRDIVLIDQRGTGKSNRLDCDFDVETDFASVDPQQLALLQERARTCLKAMAGDPRFYTTSAAVRDLDDIRAALGYPAVNIYGVSYGTRVAQHYVRRYPSRVRSVILDGAVPVDLALGPDAAPQAQRALDALFDRCAADAGCNTAFPQARAQFDALRAQLQREPRRTQLPDPIDAQPVDTGFGDVELGAAVRMLTYSDETAAVLPLLIHEAQTLQQPQGLVAQYLMIKHSTDTQIAYGMHFAVVCSEDAPRWAQEKTSEAALAASYMGASFMAGMKAICDVWPHGFVDKDFNAPLASAAPALILSGANDPVTPPDYGVRALSSFKQGRHLVLAGQGHGQIATGCMPRIVAQFIESADAAKLDASCLDAVTPAPFMLSRTATAP